MRHYRSGRFKFINPFIAKARKQHRKRCYGDLESTVREPNMFDQLAEQTGQEEAREENLAREGRIAGAYQKLSTAQAQAAEAEQSLLWKKYATQVQKNKKMLSEANSRLNRISELSEVDKGAFQSRIAGINEQLANVDSQMSSWKLQAAELDTKSDLVEAEEKARKVYSLLKQSQERYEGVRRQLRKKYGVVLRTPGFTIKPIRIKPFSIGGGYSEAVA